MKSGSMPVFIVTDFVRNGRPRTYYAHLPAQDVYNLWELIDRIAAHPASDPGDARIIFDLSVNRNRQSALIGVFSVDCFPHQLTVDLIVAAIHHRPKLEHQKDAAIHSDALLLQEHRTP